MHPSPHPPSPSSCLEKNLRILIVDDHAAIHDDFRKILCTHPDDAAFEAAESEIFGEDCNRTPRLKFELSFATQGEQALELVSAAKVSDRRFSLVFMDVRMPPGWDGLETTRRIWDVDPDLQIVICTAYSDRSWEQMMGKIANSERVLILKKPFDPIEVLQLAHALTEKWALLQAARCNKDELEKRVAERTRELLSANSRLAIETAGHLAAVRQVREQAILLEIARDAILVRSLDDTIQFWNRGAEILYGWTAAEAIGGNINELLYAGIANKPAMAARATVLKKGSWSGELSPTNRDGRRVVCDCRWTLVRDEEGQPKSILCINTDVTTKKQLESRFLRTQRMESIGTLAGGIAHDLNNILQPLTLAMDILRDEISTSAGRNMLDLVCQNTRRATSLVGQVLTFARGMEGERITVRPNELAGEISTIIGRTFPKNIVFRLLPDPDERQVLGDSTQLHQVLLNLCVNARDAMQDGGVLTLTVENVPVTEQDAAGHHNAVAGRHVVWSVNDTGAGVPSALLEKIWDPFFTTKALGMGSGLGLATALGIVHSHGGFIIVDSKEDHGTTFRVFLPADDSVSNVPPPASVEPSRCDLRGHGELILIVDDEAAIISVLRAALEFSGYRVLTANNGSSGLRMFLDRQNEIQAVITDMVMPGMDGPALIAELKKTDPSVRIIATTGMTTEANVETIRLLGVHHVVPKPCAVGVTLEALQEVLAVSPSLS